MKKLIKKVEKAIKDYGELSERCLRDVRHGSQIARKYYETHQEKGLPKEIAETLTRFGIVYPNLQQGSVADPIEEGSVVMNFYLYQKFYSQIRRRWEEVASSGDEASQREFRSLFSYFRSDQDFLRILGFEGSILEGGISYTPEDHLTCYQAVRKKIQSLKIGDRDDKKLDPVFWDKVFTRFQYGARGLKLEGGKAYAIAAHNNIDAIRVMLGDNSKYRRQGKYESCTPIYSAGTAEGLIDRAHAPFLYGTYNKKSETLGVVYDLSSIEVLSGDMHAYGSFGQEPAMIPKSELVPATKDSSKIGELRDGRLFLTDITKFDTSSKKVVPNFGEKLDAPSAVMLAVSNVWRRSNITPYLDPRNMSSAQYVRKLGFNNRYPDATNRGRALYGGQDKYAELLISHKGSMRSSVDGIFIDTTGVKSGKIESQNLNNILRLMASYPFLQFYIYDRDNSRGNVMRSYSSLVAREVLYEFSYEGEFCRLEPLLAALDASAQEEVNKKAIMLNQIKSEESSELLSKVEIAEGPQGFRVTDGEGLELFSPVATSKIESDIEEVYGISQAVFFESRYQRMLERFKEGKLMYADPSLTERKIRQWIYGLLMSSMMVISEDKDKHRAHTVEIQNMSYDSKDFAFLSVGMKHLLESFDRIFVESPSRDDIRGRLMNMYKVADDFIKKFDRKPIIEIFKELFPAEYNPESSFSARITDFIQRSGLQDSNLQFLLESNSDLIDSFINEERFQEFRSNIVAIPTVNDEDVAISLDRWIVAAVHDSKRLFNDAILQPTYDNLVSSDVKDISTTLLIFFDRVAEQFPFIHESYKERFFKEVGYLSLSEQSSKKALCDFFAEKIAGLKATTFDSKAISSFVDNLIDKVTEVARNDIRGEIGPVSSGGAPAPQKRKKSSAISASAASRSSSQSKQMDSVIDRAIAEITEILADNPIKALRNTVEINKTEGLLTSVDQNFSITKLNRGLYEVDIDSFKFQLQRVGPRSPLKITGDNPDDAKTQLAKFLEQKEVMAISSSAATSSRATTGLVSKEASPAPPIPPRSSRRSSASDEGIADSSSSPKPPPRPPKKPSASGNSSRFHTTNPFSSMFLQSSKNLPIPPRRSSASGGVVDSTISSEPPPRPPKKPSASGKKSRFHHTNPFADNILSASSDPVPPELPPKLPPKSSHTKNVSQAMRSTDVSVISAGSSVGALPHAPSAPSSVAQVAQDKISGTKGKRSLPIRPGGVSIRRGSVAASSSSSTSAQSPASAAAASQATRRGSRKLPKAPGVTAHSASAPPPSSRHSSTSSGELRKKRAAKQLPKPPSSIRPTARRMVKVLPRDRKSETYI